MAFQRGHKLPAERTGRACSGRSQAFPYRSSGPGAGLPAVTCPVRNLRSDRPARLLPTEHLFRPHILFSARFLSSSMMSSKFILQPRCNSFLAGALGISMMSVAFAPSLPFPCVMCSLRPCVYFQLSFFRGDPGGLAWGPASPCPAPPQTGATFMLLFRLFPQTEIHAPGIARRLARFFLSQTQVDTGKFSCHPSLSAGRSSSRPPIPRGAAPRDPAFV